MKFSSKLSAFAVCAVLLFGVLLLSGCNLGTALCSDTRFALDTFCTVSLYDSNDKEILNQCFDLIEHYEGIFSKSRENSDVYKINHSAGNKTEVTQDTLYVINRCRFYHELTDGMFDITLGRVTELWDFRDNPHVPEADSLNDAVATVGIDNLITDGNTVSLKNPKTALDLGAAAKGYIADKLAEFLRNNGVNSALINLGGNVYAVGCRKENIGFAVGLSKPFENDGVFGRVEITDKSVVTSGVSQRCFYGDDGTLYHHLLDVKTGMPFKSPFTSVSIIADSSLEADLLSTAVYFMGDKGIDYLNQSGVAQAVCYTEDGKIVTTQNINTYRFEEM